MIPRKLENDYYLICGIDRRLEKFENMFTLPYGVSYNSYFLGGPEPLVIDSTDAAVADEYMELLEGLLEGQDLAHIISNHVEPDHCATLIRMMEKNPDAKLYISKLGSQLLQQFKPGMEAFASRIQIIDDASELEIAGRTFHFMKAPNVHWPEVTFTFDKTSGTLFSADAFGSFAAPAGYIYADQVNYDEMWLNEARRYYCNIVGRHGLATQKALKKAEALEIKYIYPLHGLLFREPKTINHILDKYEHWSSYEAEEAGTVIVYGSMYGHSQKLADSLAAFLAEGESQNQIRVYDVSKTNVSQIVADLFRFSHAVFVCNNYNTELYPPMDALLRELMMLNWDNHKYSLVGNMSWGGRGIQIAEEILSQAKNLTPVGDQVVIKSSPSQDNLDQLTKLAQDIAASY